MAGNDLGQLCLLLPSYLTAAYSNLPPHQVSPPQHQHMPFKLKSTKRPDLRGHSETVKKAHENLRFPHLAQWRLDSFGSLIICKSRGSDLDGYEL